MNGTSYPVATLDTFTIDEGMVLWDYGKLTIDQLPKLEGFHPGVAGALIHVSIARAEPNVKASDIRELVGNLKIVDLEQVFADITKEGDAGPPASSGADDSTNERSGPTSDDDTAP